RPSVRGRGRLMPRPLRDKRTAGLITKRYAQCQCNRIPFTSPTRERGIESRPSLTHRANVRNGAPKALKTANTADAASANLAGSTDYAGGIDHRHGCCIFPGLSIVATGNGLATMFRC